MEYCFVRWFVRARPPGGMECFTVAVAPKKIPVDPPNTTSERANPKRGKGTEQAWFPLCL